MIILEEALMNKKADIKNRKERLSPDRMNALSDGVIAVVITLLVLGIDIPDDHSFTEEGLFSFFRNYCRITCWIF